jgi:alanine-glyoxylate transaminase/serine-glyoxylate transaminase/serine-pyruvate transaminase
MPAGRSKLSLRFAIFWLKEIINISWLPIMKAYESGSASYFATPPVNLIYAYRTSLCEIVKTPPTLEERFKLHREVSQRIKSAASDLGLKQLPLDPAHAANGMTAVRHNFSQASMT